MGLESSDSGMDELMRLSRQFTKQKQEHEARAKQREAQGKKVHGVLQGLKDLNLSMAVQQLKPIATQSVIREVNSLKAKAGTEDLRKLISDLANELENRLGSMAVSKSEAAPLVNSMKTLNILIDLYFSLQ